MNTKRMLLILIFFIFAILFSSCTLDNPIIELSPSAQSSIENDTQLPTPSVPITPLPPSSTLTPTAAPIPSPSETTQPAPVSFSILAAGDVMAHGDNLKSAYNSSTGEYSFIENYKHVKSIIDEADLAICNLETVTAGLTEEYTSYPRFNTPVAILDGLKFAGFDVLVTANNHSLDRGEAGVIRTLNEIHRRNMLTTGSYLEPGTNFLTTEIKDTKVSILAYTQHLNGNLPLLSENKHFMINQMNKQSIIDDIESASVNSNLVIVYLHWGNEYTRGTEEWQPEYAYDLIEAGADVILGTHPHVVRPDEVYIKDGEPKYIIYSMGNYISNFIREDNRTNAIYTEDGVMIKLNFIQDSEGEVHIESVVPIPTWPYKYINETGIHYEIIPVENIDSIVHDIPYADQQAKDSYQRTMESLTGYNQKN